MNSSCDGNSSDVDSLPDNNSKSNANPDTGLFNMNLFNNTLTSQIKILNEDFNLLGHYGILDFINEVVYLNMNKLVSTSSTIVNSHKDKIKLIEDMEQKKKWTTSELTRIEKLYSKKFNENELLITENKKLKEIIKESDKKIKSVNKQMKSEQINIKNFKFNIEREKNQIQASKQKLEKEMDCLKERLNKLLIDPKRQYASIAINSVSDRPIQRSASAHRKIPNDINFENEIKQEMYSNFTKQVDDFAVENRQLREQLMIQLIQLKKLCGKYCDIKGSIEKSERNQINNNSLSRHSSISDDSLKSNETFVISKSSPTVDERIYLELQFDLVKNDITQSFQECFQKLNNVLKGNVSKTHVNGIPSTSSDDKLLISHSNEAPTFQFSDNRLKNHNRDLPASPISINLSKTQTGDVLKSPNNENINRLQKEIFQLRKRITDYEDIILTKDSYLESAIQQRIKRGSLVSGDY